MAGKDVTILAQALDGTWQTIGSESARGVFPADVVLESDQWGSLSASFNLRRDPRAFWPDIAAFTPIEVEVAGRLVWSGRVKETPSQVAQRMMNVQCEGWQFHLDDDIYQRTYVHDRLTDWKDATSVLTQDLTVYTAAGSVTSGQSGVVLNWLNGAILPSNCRVGVTLDLGPGNTAAGTSVLLQGVTGPANSGAYLFVRAHANPGEASSGGVYSDAASIALSTLGTNPWALRGPFSDPYRYVTIFLYAPAGVTLNGDVSVQVRHARIFTDDAYRASGGDMSVLRASTVVRDALSRATVLLSDDLSGIADTSFDLSSYVPPWQSVRQAWSAVDAHHDWLKKVGVDRKPVYQPKPSRPIFEVGAWSAISDDDASANSGSEIYNRAVGIAQAPDGSPVVVDGLTDGTLDLTDIAQPANPSATVNTSGWTALYGALNRDTGTFDSSPASFKITAAAGGGGAVQSASVTQTIAKGRRYRLTLLVRRTAALTGNLTIALQGPAGAVRRLIGDELAAIPTGTFTPINIDWIAKADATAYTLLVSGFGPGATSADLLWFDSIQFGALKPTLVDRCGFSRAIQLPIGNTLPDDGIALRAISTVWLNGHKTTPFRGTATLVGDESVREILTGRPVGLETLLLNTVELMRFSDRADPDTAGHGRDGRIAHVSYTPAADTAVVTIDNSRTSFEAMLSRLAVIQG